MLLRQLRYLPTRCEVLRFVWPYAGFARKLQAKRKELIQEKRDEINEIRHTEIPVLIYSLFRFRVGTGAVVWGHEVCCVGSRGAVLRRLYGSRGAGE